MLFNKNTAREALKTNAIDVAENIIATQGVAGIRARRVAEELGCAVGTLYLAFRNMDNLIMAVNGRSLEVLYQNMQQAAQTYRSNPAATVRAMAQAYVEYAKQQTYCWQALFEHRRQSNNQAPLPKAFQEKIERLFAQVEMPMQALLGALGETSTLTVEIETRALWAGVHGIAQLVVNDKLSVSPAEVTADDVLAALLRRFLNTK